MHSSDIGIAYDLGSKTLLQPKKIRNFEDNGQLCLLFEVIWNEKITFISIPS